MYKLTGRVAFITAGSTCIGLANAERAVVGASALIARRRPELRTVYLDEVEACQPTSRSPFHC